VTLQLCLNKALVGDTIQIDVDNLAATDPFITIKRSVSLVAQTGFSPTLTQIGVTDNGSSLPLAVTIDGLGVTDAIQGMFTGGSGHSLTIRHARVAQASPQAGPGISLDAEVPSTLEVVNSTITFDNQYAGIQFFGNWSGTSVFKAIGNYITARNSSSSGSAFDIRSQAATNTLHADIMNNAIFDVANCHCGGASGMFLQLQSTSTTALNVVANTFQSVQANDLLIENLLTSGGSASLDVFNNVFADTVDAAMLFDDSASTASRVALHAGTNDTFNSGIADALNGRSAGTGNLAVDPKFVDGASGDMRLTSSSTLINAGQVCSVGGVSNPDAAGNSRVSGKSIDLGAYERGSGVPTGQVFMGTSGPDTITGTSGADIICGMGGNDTLTGGGGADFIDGGSGTDKITGGGGADWLNGGAGNDILCAKDGVGGNDHINGGAGTDGYQEDTGDFAVNVEKKVTC
jgi:hypothetical protein